VEAYLNEQMAGLSHSRITALQAVIDRLGNTCQPIADRRNPNLFGFDFDNPW